MAIDEQLRPSNRPAEAGSFRALPFVLLAVVATASAFLAGAVVSREAPQVEFLQQALGEARADAPLTRRPDERTRVELHSGGYALERGPVTVGLRSTAGGDGALQVFARGASRRTPYGWEAVTVGPERTEQYLTVTERQGRTTWRWELDTAELTPRVGDDGVVAFIRGGRLLSDVAFIEPVRILDRDGEDVTPVGARWSVARSGGRWYLELPLDDSHLPLPYVIDPAISNRSVGVSTPDNAATTEVVPVPAGVVAGDVLIAQVTSRGDTTITGVTGQPSGGGAFTSIDRRVTTGTVITQEVLYRVATASEPATSYTFALSASVKASAGIAAYVDAANQANPINVSGGQANNTASTTAAAPSVTTTVADTRLLTLVGAATGNGTTNWSGLTNERWDTASTSGTAGTRTSTGMGDESFVGPGTTPARSGTNAASAVSVGQTVAIAPLAADGSGTLTTPTTSVSSQSTGNTITFTYTAATGGMRGGSVTLAVPSGWSAPSTTSSNAGYTTSSSGTVGSAGQTITVSGLTLTSGSTVTVVYGSKAGGGPGATAPGPAGAQTWQAQQRSSATSGALANLGASPSVTVTPGPAAQISLSGSTADLASGATRVLTATIQDAAGNTVTSDSSTVVTFAKQSGAGTVSGTGTATAASGVATKTVTGALAGSVTMEATATGLTTGTLGAFTIVPGAAAQIALSGSTADLAAGSTRVLTATIQDAAGNTVASDSSTVVTFAKQSGAGSVNGTGTATAASGVATKTITGTLAGSVTMQATATGLTTGTLGAFNVVAGPAAQIALTGSTADLASGSTRVLTATVQDAGGNTVTSDNSTVIAFAKQSGAGSVTGTGTATASSGVATRTVTGSLAGSVTMEATATGLTTGALGAFTVVHGTAAQIALSGSTADLASGSTRVLTATIQDAAGNTVTADSSTVVTFAKQSGAGTVTGTGTATAANGVATKTITGALVGSVTTEATATGLTTGTLGAFTVVPGNATQVALTGSTADLASGSTRVLTATIQDAAGNTVTSDSSTVVTFAKQSGSGTVTGTGTATASSGVATKSITGALAGSVTIEATATGLSTATLGAFTVVHGAAAQIALSGSTADLASGSTRVLTATIQDAAGNTVTSDNSTVVTFAKQSGSGTVTGTGAATASSGVATKTVTGALAGSVTLEASASGLTTGVLGAFAVVHGPATQIELTHSGSTASGDNHTLTATLKDAAGNTATSDSSTVVAFAKSGGAGTVTGLGNATASNGAATKVVANAAAGQIDLDAQAAGLTTGTTSYTITPGSASTTTSTIGASPTSIVANGSSTSAITVRLKDAIGNDLNGSGGAVALALVGPGSLSSVTDNGDGTYSATLTSTTTVGSATVTGTLNAAALVSTATVTYTHGPATQIVLTESGSTVSGEAHTLTATIRDANGNTVTSDSSTVVAFAKTGGAGTVTGVGSATASAGVATKAVTNVLAGQIDLDAQAAGLATGTVSYTIGPGPVSAAASDSTVVAAPASIYANGVDTATITVTLRDVAGNGVPGKTVTLAQGTGSSTITGGGATNGSGVVTFSVSDATVETVTYTATDTTDSITLADEAAVDFTITDTTPPTNVVTLTGATRALLSGATLYYNGAAGGSFELSSAVADAGAGPASATYPAVAQPGWTHGAETVVTPAGGPFVSSTFTFGPGAAGDFAYVVSAADLWTPANTSGTTLTMTDDSTAPVASVSCNAVACSGGWYTASPVSVTLAAPDAGAGLDQIRYTTDGTDPTVLTGSVYAGSFAVAAEGVTTVRYRAFDRIGNDTGVQTQVIRIDTVAPDTALDSTPAAATQDTTPTFAFSSAEGGTTFEARVGAGSWAVAASPLTIDPLSDGTYTFEVRASDAAGNVDATPASFVFTVDTTAADTTITAAPAADSGSTNASFSFTASDAGPGFECRLDGAAFAGCTSAHALSGLAEGAHTFEVRAKDAAGNVDPTPATSTWTVDLTAPDTSFLSTPANPSASTAPTFGLGSTEAPATFECDLDGGGWAPCATPFTTPVLADGSHTLDVRASDAAGNTDASAAAYTWLVDATAPTGNVTSPADGAAVGGTVALTSGSADAGSGIATIVFERSPAGVGAWTSQAASWDTTLQADGDYDLRVRTTDNAGNVFTSPAITVTVDNTEPTLTVVAPNPVSLATADPASVRATASDDGSGVADVRFEQCAEDSSACVSDSWVLLGVDATPPYAASWPLPSDGPRLLRVRATDNAGRQRTELVLVTVDRTRPTGTLTAPAGGADLRGASVALAATASDAAPGNVNTVTFQRSPAGAGTWTDISTDSAAPYTGALDTTALTDGLYDLRVFTTDAAGNAETAPATIQVRVDNTLPTGSVTNPAGGANVRGTITLTSDSADTGSGVATVQFQRSPAGAGTWTSQAASFDTTAVADGLYDLRVTTTDNAGNAFTSGATSVRVDNTLPTGSVTSPAGGANVRGTIALTSDSADTGSGVATVQFQRSPAGAGTWTNQTASFDTTAVADGLYDLRVRTTDNAGNVFTSPEITVRVDNTLPTGSVTAPADGAEIGVPPVTLTSDSADAGSGVATVTFERSLAGVGIWTSTPSTWDTASGAHAVTDGSYDLRVITTDNAGNVFTSAAVTVLVDHTAPTTTASLAPGSPSNAPVTVSFSASDGAGSGVDFTSYRVDGGSVQTGAAVVIAAPGDHSNDGAHLLEFFSTDDVGNVEAAQDVTVVIDTTAPSGSGGNPGDYLRGIATLTYSTAASDVSSVQFQFAPTGTGAWTSIGLADIAPPYEASWNTALVVDGAYDLRAVVTDATGNTANTLLPGLPKTVDNTAPTASVTAPLAGATVSGSVAIDASAGDGAMPPASGVSAVRFEMKPSGAGAFTVFGTQTAPVVGSTYRETLATAALADGPAELRVVVTDLAGNETTSGTRTVTVDNQAPVVALDDPGASVGASVALTATSSADTADVAFRYRPVGSGGAGTLIASDTTAPFGVTWTTAPAAEQQWELIAVATDGGGNVTTSAPRVVLVDRTAPTGSVTSPTGGATVGGPAVALAASAADTAGSGVTRVEWQVKEFGAAGFTTVADDTTAPFASTWDSTSAPDGAADIRARLTDAAGNVAVTSVVAVVLDSSGPSVSLADPGATLSGTVALTATTGGGASRVQFSVSPANAATWTQLGEDGSAPFAASFDTTALADGLYDLRAVGFDALGNASAPSLREDVLVDNTAPRLVGSTPGDGSVSAAANQIVLTASEPVTAPGTTLDGAAAPSPSISGSQLTFSTGALADGLHVLSGELEDAAGTRTPFRVAVTIESSVGADRPPVELSASGSGSSTLTSPGGLASVTLPAAALPAPPTASDFVVVRVDLAPPAPVLGTGLLPGTQLVEVTARWALAGTPVTAFAAPIDVLIANPSGDPVIPATSDDGTSWRTLAALDGPSLPADRQDGWYRDGAGVHVLTRHLTWFALLRDVEPPSPPSSLAGVVAADGLTLRWLSSGDGSGQLGNFVLFVNGEGYREFGPTEFEAKLGAVAGDDTRTFTLAQKDAAGNLSPQTRPIRVVPPLAGRTLAEARADLGAAGFAVGDVRETAATTALPGTVVAPTEIQLAAAGTPIDLIVARAVVPPQARLAVALASSQRIALGKPTTIGVRLTVTKPVRAAVTLRDSKLRRLHNWVVRADAGATVLRLRLPSRVGRAGRYSLTWIVRSGSETVSRTISFRLMTADAARGRAGRQSEVVLVGRTPASDALKPRAAGVRRITRATDADHAFGLLASQPDVRVVVVDADAFGTRFVTDLRSVFPSVRVIAISREPATRSLAIRAGAVLALRRDVSARRLAKAVAALAAS